jgi:hypothetical protein
LAKRRKTPTTKPLPSLPRGIGIRRLQSLSALARAFENARRLGALGVKRERGPKRPRTQSDQDIIKKTEQRIDLMIELELQWRLQQLGVTPADASAPRFKPFRFDSDHRRLLEARHMHAENERRRAAAKAG